ncbi:FAD-dependent oxidoreductase [Streptosporangium carneum]|uniref:Kynurenine 3-monooxygenase n=1 Tax=Streptosporangium carneum TaxID=47481 RepID=A0A9W6MF72_9ACTN|nr:NAD(P)/FAD-dependent oxidoreductase [Streptosporangium carneum]GLK12339.1 kynurenine 3-monooxygenase [Streptosporangium carneum]
MTAPRVAIVGAGLAGSLMAVLLGRRGFHVEVYERRGDPRQGTAEEGARSINLGLSRRGLKALREIGLLDSLRPRTVPMRGRAVHRPDGQIDFHPYGTNDDQILHSVMRGDLNVALIERALSFERVRFLFRTAFERLDKDKGIAYLTDEETGEELTVAADAVIGADGVFSAVRREMQRGEPADYRQEFLDWGYKQLTIPPAADGSPRTLLEAFHVWPGSERMLIAQPNHDNSLTGTLFLPLRGEGGFEALTSPATVERFFRTHFPDALGLMPDLVREFAANPVGTLVTVRTSPWSHGDKAVLVGDACHAVYPFYGQGMNAAFEDCLRLDACLRTHPDDWATAFRRYQESRKPHTDVLADLSAEHFTELRDRLRSPLFALRKQADVALHGLFPELWQPLYTMVSHTTIPYADALERARRQERVLRRVGGGAAALVGLSAACAVTWAAARRRHGR